MSIILRITDAGRAALVNAAHDGTNAVRIASVGVSPTAIVAAANTAALPGEVKRIATVSGTAVAADVIHLVVRDETADTYTVRSFALYLADGTLFAAYGQAAPIIEKSAGALLLLAIDSTLVDIAAGQVTFGNANFLNPPATTEMAGVVELATDAEVDAGIDAMRAATPAQLKRYYAKLSGANFTGAISAPSVGAVAGGNGGLVMAAGSTTAIGYISFRDNQGAQTSYIGANGFGAPLIISSSAGIALSASRLTRDGNVIWDAANDGAGSGLDADLLDGRHASDFALLAGAAFTGPVSAKTVKTSATDSGVGGWYVNAEFVSSYFPMIRLGGSLSGRYASVGAGNDGSLQFFVNGDAGVVGTNALNISPAGVVSAITDLSVGGNRVWHVGNDGAGSGLDADLLDGRHGDAFALLTGAAFSGGIQAPSVGAVAGGIGGIVMAPGSASAIGYLSFRDSQGSQTAYIGSNGFGSRLALACGAGFDFSGPSITRGGQIVWDASNDGSGSGLDADLLDGRQASEFALVAGATFSGGVSAPSLAAIGIGLAGVVMAPGSATEIGYFSFRDNQGSQTAYIGANSFGAPLIVSCSAGIAFSAAKLTRGGNAIWDAANDGAGSGLDADLLDGWHRDEVRAWANLLDKPAVFPPTAHTHVAAFVSAANGSRTYDDGYKECWGSTYIPANSTINIPLPVAHTAWCVPVGSCSIAQDEASIGVVAVLGAPPDSFNVRNRNPMATTFYWHTRGV